MFIEHDGKRPTVDPSASIATSATLSGDVTVGPNTSIGHGAVVTAETGPVRIGENCVVMEHAVLRGTRRAPLEVGNHVLIGPHAHLSGCRIDDRVFIATQASVFPHAQVGPGSVIRIGAVVHIRTVLPPASSLPIQWIAVGDPPELFSPDQAEQVLDRLQRLGFSRTVFGVEPVDDSLGHMPDVLRRYNRALARRGHDRIVSAPDRPT